MQASLHRGAALPPACSANLTFNSSAKVLACEHCKHSAVDCGGLPYTVVRLHLLKLVCC